MGTATVGALPAQTRGLKSRQDKFRMWTAVALQQHIALGGASTACSGGNASSSLEAVTSTGPCLAKTPSRVSNDTHPRLLPVQVNAVLPSLPHHARLTLAQRMGLVQAPPPPPTEDEWFAVEARALLREQYDPEAKAVSGKAGVTSCSICYTTFSRTADQGQVILSCSHVFHERCFKQFERFVRAQQREAPQLLDVSAPRLACPECRTTHYYKRTYFAGKALAQRAAVVKIQSIVRGYLARRQYTKCRLRVNVEFRQSYILNRLERLSKRWEKSIERQEVLRKRFLACLEVRRQSIAGAYMVESDWQNLVRRHLFRENGSVLPTHRLANPCDCSGQKALISDATSSHCSICLERIEVSVNILKGKTLERVTLASPLEAAGSNVEFRFVVRSRRYSHAKTVSPSGNVGDPSARSFDRCNGGEPVEEVSHSQASEADDFIKKLRFAYERKRDKVQRGQRTGPKRNSTSEVRPPKANARVAPKPRPNCHHPSVRSACKGRAVGEPKEVPKEYVASELVASRKACKDATEERREQVEGGNRTAILSCGHLFHNICLTAFEKYQQWYETRSPPDRTGNVDKSSDIAMPPRCPLCRSGYAKCLL